MAPRLNAITRVAKMAGDAVAQRDALPKLGLEALDAAAKGQVGVEDVNDLYLTYYKAANPFSKIDEAVLTSFPFKVNASKLRQLVKLGEQEKSAGRELVKRALLMRDRLAAGGEHVKPTYHAMVEVARIALRQGCRLSDNALRKAVLA